MTYRSGEYSQKEKAKGSSLFEEIKRRGQVYSWLIFEDRKVDETKRIHQIFPQRWNRYACSTLQNFTNY